MAGLWMLFGLRGLILLDSLLGSELKSIVFEFKHRLLWAMQTGPGPFNQDRIEALLLFSLSFDFFKIHFRIFYKNL
ncbi:hypothetical protein BT93_C0989 [Corymbia citriodora subsp. variegata]|nr:hypothetical protein BT93_C0989 [Corymbia citriodora subsp. variegata]